MASLSEKQQKFLGIQTILLLILTLKRGVCVTSSLQLSDCSRRNLDGSKGLVNVGENMLNNNTEITDDLHKVMENALLQLQQVVKQRYFSET